MILSSTPKSLNLSLVVPAGCALIFAFLFLASLSPSYIHFSSGVHSAGFELNPGHLHQNTALEKNIKNLFASSLTSPTQPNFTDEQGYLFELAEAPRYTQGLGKRILILDLETRPLKSIEDWARGGYDWAAVDHVSGGVFNHYTYSLIHGYDYKLLQVKEPTDRCATWIKPSALASLLSDYSFVVFADADAAFHALHLPIEWLLNFWHIEPQHALAMPLDPWDPAYPDVNADRFNRTLLNTGFIIAQKTARTLEILQAWHECPEDTRYQSCSQWKTPRFHEQSAFGEFVRYDYEDYIKELPCADANGFPGTPCRGNFVRHYWFEKTRVKDDFANAIMQILTEPMQSRFARNASNLTETFQ